MKYIKSFVVLSTLFLAIFGCEKDEDENVNPIAETSSIYYQEFSIDTTEYSDDTISYDVNNDGVFDIEVFHYIVIENSEAQYRGQFKWINAMTEFCFMKYNPSISMIKLGDEINGNANLFKWEPIINYSGSIEVLGENHYWAYGLFTEYFGFRHISNQGSLYGWFRFKHFELAEMAINTIPNEPILVGQKK